MTDKTESEIRSINKVRNLKTWTEVEIHPSAYELAEVFWAMDDEEQGCFFERLYCISGGRLPFQMQAVIEHPNFSEEARRAMQTIGEYGEIL